MKQDNTRKGHYKTSKLLYRRRVTIKPLERYGIMRGDTAIVVFDGDIKTGELGYFSINHWGQNYDQFRFVCKKDSGCLPYTKNKRGVCLRTYKPRCEGSHEGQPYGRIVSIERNGQTVETELTFRPFDERESRLLREQNPLPTASSVPQSAPRNSAKGFKVGEYVRFKRNPKFGLFRVTKIQDMTGWYGWENGSALIYMQQPNGKPMPCAMPSSDLVPAKKKEGERERERRLRQMVEGFNMKFSISEDGRLRITRHEAQ